LTIQDFEYITKEYGALFEFINSKENEMSKMSMNDYFLYSTNPPFSKRKSYIYFYTSFIKIKKN